MSGALRSRINPGLDQLAEQCLVTRSRFAPHTGLPPPSHKIIMGEMIVQLCQIAAPISIGVFELLADFSD